MSYAQAKAQATKMRCCGWSYEPVGASAIAPQRRQLSFVSRRELAAELRRWTVKLDAH